MSRVVERLRACNRQCGPPAALRVLGPLAVAGILLTAAVGTAQAAGSVPVEVVVWQHSENASDIRVGAGPADGSWPAPELIPLPLDAGVSSSGRYRFGDIAIEVQWRIGAAPVTVEVRVWQHVEDEGNLHISARGSLGSWRTLGTVALAGATGSSVYRTGGVTIEAPLPKGETGAPRRYRLDPAGEATEPGSYAFLTAPLAQEITTYEGLRHDAASVRIEIDEHGEATYTFYTAPRASVITTFEGLRRNAATLRLNATAADGASSEGLFGAVEAGHLIEWFHARGCFVRYRVTSIAEAEGDAPYREFGVRRETYVFQGCQSGSLPVGGTTAAFSAARELPLEHLGGTRLPSSHAVVHGVWELYSGGGVARETDVLIPEGSPAHIPPEFANTGTITSVTDARKFPYWREPTLPSGWQFYRLYVGGGGDLPPGYEAFFADGSGDHALEIRGEHVVGSPLPWEATWLTNVGERIVREPRTVANRPAVVMYSPNGPQQAKLFWARVDIYDPATGTVYTVIGSARMGGGPAGLERVLAIARSLFERPAPTVTPTTYALTLSAATGGSLSADPAGESHAAGAVVTVTATAADGYKFSSWGDDCAGTPATSTTCSLTMDADRTASATFAKNSAPTTLRYSTYDTTGQAATAGSYAFLTANGAGSQSEGARQSEGSTTPVAVTTYEGMRTEADTLRIHLTDGSGVSRASFYGTVEVGDTFEWREASDCWVRYLVTAVKPGTSPREFAIKPYSYTYTGCSGTVGGGSQGDSARDGAQSSSTRAVRDFTWKPEKLKTGTFTSPTWHGPWLLIPANWTGPIPQTVLFTPPVITWPPDPIPDPDLGTGWSGSITPGYPPSELEGWYSHTDGGRLIIYIFQFGRWPFDVYRLAASPSAAGVIHEFGLIDGRYAVVSYDRVKTGISEAQVAIYDDATGLMYSAIGGPLSRNNDPEPTINLLQKFILP